MDQRHVRNIAVDVILTVITCGLFNLFVQYKQMEAVNDMLKQNKYNFWLWLLLTIITCGLYHIYHEYRKSCDIARMLKKDEASAGLTAVILTLVGWLSFGVAIIINDAIQQSEINSYYGNTQL